MIQMMHNEYTVIIVGTILASLLVWSITSFFRTKEGKYATLTACFLSISVIVVYLSLTGTGGGPPNGPCGWTYEHLETNEVASVDEKCFVVGDIFVNETRFFDYTPNTGLIVDFRIFATVRAPYGADIVRVADTSCKNSLIEERKKQEMAANPNCKRVDVVVFGGSQTQPQP